MSDRDEGVTKSNMQNLHIANPGVRATEQEIVVYKPSEKIKLEVKTDGETIWLTQEQMCLLFGRERSVITKHIRNVFNEGELPREGFMQILHKNVFRDAQGIYVQNLHINQICENSTNTRENSRKTPTSRGRPAITLYNLDVVISVGYRVKSFEGTRFRQWATRVLRQMLLNRLDEVKRIGKLEHEVDALRGDVKQIKGGMSYLVEQLSVPQEPMRRRIGFGASETDHPAKPYGKL